MVLGRKITIDRRTASQAVRSAVAEGSSERGAWFSDVEAGRRG